MLHTHSRRGTHQDVLAAGISSLIAQDQPYVTNLTQISYSIEVDVLLGRFGQIKRNIHGAGHLLYEYGVKGVKYGVISKTVRRLSGYCPFHRVLNVWVSCLLQGWSSVRCQIKKFY